MPFHPTMYTQSTVIVSNSGASLARAVGRCCHAGVNICQQLCRRRAKRFAARDAPPQGSTSARAFSDTDTSVAPVVWLWCPIAVQIASRFGHGRGRALPGCAITGPIVKQGAIGRPLAVLTLCIVVAGGGLAWFTVRAAMQERTIAEQEAREATSKAARALSMCPWLRTARARPPLAVRKACPGAC